MRTGRGAPLFWHYTPIQCFFFSFFSLSSLTLAFFYSFSLPCYVLIEQPPSYTANIIFKFLIYRLYSRNCGENSIHSEHWTNKVHWNRFSNSINLSRDFRDCEWMHTLFMLGVCVVSSVSLSFSLASFFAGCTWGMWLIWLKCLHSISTAYCLKCAFWQTLMCCHRFTINTHKTWYKILFFGFYFILFFIFYCHSQFTCHSSYLLFLSFSIFYSLLLSQLSSFTIHSFDRSSFSASFFSIHFIFS